MSQEPTSRTSRRRWSARSLLAAAAVVVALVCVARRERWIEPLERSGYDILMQARGELPVDPRLVLVDVDDPTLAWLGRQPPIPRRLVADLIDRVSAGEADLIVLDALLSERQTAEDDAALVAALRHAGNVILVSSLKSAGTPRILPLPEYVDAALDVGYANLPVDSDGFVRRATLFDPAPAVQDFSVATRAATNFLGKPLELDRSRWQFRIGTVLLRGVSPARPEMFINYRGYSPRFTRISARDLLTAPPPGQPFRKRIAIIGQSFTLAPDLFQTPFFKPLLSSRPARLMPGMEIHANAVTTLLDNDSIVPVGDRRQLELDLLCLILAFVAVALLSPARGIAAVALVMALVAGLSARQFSHAHEWNRFVLEELGIVATAGTTLTVRYAEERYGRRLIAAERQKLMGIFEKYVSPEVAAEIWEHRDEIALHGQTRTATILFSDIRNFTAMSEGKPSQEILALLNDYFEGMNAIVKAHRGFINKYMGDGLLVLYGVPVSGDDRADARHAVVSALEMIEAVKARRAAQIWPFSIGVGIHTGVVAAGNIGARDRMEYSVIGEAVNLASRLESLNKEYHTELIISEETRARVDGYFQTRELGKAEIKGFHRPIAIYEVLAANDPKEQGAA